MHLRRLPALLSAFAVGLLLPAVTASAATTANPQILPYTITVVAGGATTTPTAGQSCGAGSTLVSTDAYGDGCLATQVMLSVVVTTSTATPPVTKKFGPQYVTSDARGNVYFSDTQNHLVRRVDAVTGIITTVAGGAMTSPAAGVTCGAFTSTDVLGDGCLATAVALKAPDGLAFSPQTGELFFADNGSDTVRRISAAGIISTAAGNTGNVFGYAVNNATTTITAANSTTSYLNFPYGIAFDRAGNLYIADEGNNAIEAVNLQTSTVTLAGVSIPPGTIAKIMGLGDRVGKSASGECPNYTSAAQAGGCYFGKYAEGAVAVMANTDNPYDVSVDAAGNVYFANEFNTNVAEIRTDGTVVTAAGIQGSKPVGAARGPATSTNLGSDYGLNVDSSGNIYISDSTAGYIWRVDAANQGMYVFAGGATTVCATATDASGDGCPALQAKLSSSGASATSFATYAGVQGVFADNRGNLLLADGSNGLIRKISGGAQFPSAGSAVGVASTQLLQIHFGTGDTSGTYTLATGAADFTLGTATCTANSDTTTDCLLPVTFKPSAPGQLSASLLVKSSSGLTTALALNGTGLAPVLALDPGTQTTVASTGINGVAAIALDRAGNTYAAVPTNSTLTRISAAGVASTFGTGLTKATGVAVGPGGSVYVSLGTGSVVQIPADGSAQVTLGTGFSSPSGIAVDSFGNVFVADSGAGTLTEIYAATRAQRVISSTGLTGATGVAVDSTGTVFIANGAANSVTEYPVSGSAPVTLGSGLNVPSGLAVDAAGSLYIADSRNGRVLLIPNENGKLNSADAVAIVSGLTAPAGVAVANSGAVTVADSSANAIYLYTRTGSTIAFGNDPVGTQLSMTADLASVGNLPVTLAATYYTAAGNTTDFSLTPAALTSGTNFAAGSVASLTAGFKPTTTGARAATFTFTPTNAAAPVLSVTGTGITPTNATSTIITATPTSGTYGQTVSATFTVATGTSAVPTGTLNVKVDTTAYTPTLVNGTVTVPFAGLSAGLHTITASYPGDANDSPSTATPVTITLAKAPLTISVNNVSKQFGAALPTFTGNIVGAVNNDQIGVTYTTTATQTSPLGTYPVTATPAGAAVMNYTVTSNPGTLTVVQAGTTTTVSASSLAVSSTTTVTLTATVASQTTGIPGGTVQFFNGSTPLGAPLTLNASGSASTTTTFAVSGQSTSNAITAVYSGSTNYSTSTSAAINVVVSVPGFNITAPITTLTVNRGQTGLATFTLTPTFGFKGTIGFACTGLPATIGCGFAPTSVTADGSNTASLITVSFTTVQPGALAQLNAPQTTPSGRRNLAPLAYAGLPGVLLLSVLLGRRRKGLTALRSSRLWMLAGLLSVMLLGASGCGNGRSTNGTTAGTYAITVVATGTPSAGTTTVTQQFTVNLTVK